MKSEGAEPDVKTPGDLAGKKAVEGYDIVLFGTPTYGNRRYNMPAKQVESFIKSLEPDGLSGKTVVRSR